MGASPDGSGSEQAWLAWEGRWGERQPWEYNGPLGPATTGRWADPVGWQAGLRDSSIVVPGSAAFGPGPTDVFCDATELGSRLLTRWAVEPLRVVSMVVLVVGVFVALMALARRTIVEAFRVYMRHLPIFALLGLLLIPVGIAANGFQYLVVTYPPGREVAEVMRFSPASDFAAAVAVGGVQELVSLLIVAPAVLVVYRDIERGVTPTLVGTLRGIRERFWLMLRAMGRPLGMVFLAAITVVGIPWAVERSVRWSLTPQAVVLDDISPEDAPPASAGAVRGHWWRTAGTVFVLGIIGSAPGPIIGILLMLTEGASVAFVNTLSSIIYAAVLPFSILGSAILYRRRQGQMVGPVAGDTAPIPSNTVPTLRTGRA